MTPEPSAAAATVSSRGGRPSRERAAQIGDLILDAATALFLSDGYGTTSIEMVARRARVSKRTLYQRFPGKPALFEAVMHRLVARLRPPNVDGLFVGGSLGEVLTRIADIILGAALAPDAIAIHRMMIAEVGRFPELGRIADALGTRQEAVMRIAALLQRLVPAVYDDARAKFAAEQFLQMVVALPQRRALGLGQPMTADELHRWARDTVSLFLRGLIGFSGAATPP